MFSRFALSNGIGCAIRLRVRQDRHGERHRFFPFQTIRGTFSHPGVEHLRLPGCVDVVVLWPANIWIGVWSDGVGPVGEPPPHDNGDQTESEDADADEPDEDGRR